MSDKHIVSQSEKQQLFDSMEQAINSSTDYGVFLATARLAENGLIQITPDIFSSLLFTLADSLKTARDAATKFYAASSPCTCCYTDSVELPPT